MSKDQSKNQIKTYLGHRKRVKEKFIQSLGKELHDYELIEILLFSSIARSDTKELAKKLLKKFGSLSAVINADIDNLREVEGVGDSTIIAIKVVGEILTRIMKEKISKKTILNNWQSLFDYAKIVLSDLNYEVFRVIFLDKKFQIIEDELINIGENDAVKIDTKIIVKKALILHSSSIILMHNHPASDAKPSNSDIKTTKEIIDSLKNLEIKVIDHLIIAKNSYFSFRENGLI
jgi:DNA repair protein RadC